MRQRLYKLLSNNIRLPMQFQSTCRAAWKPRPRVLLLLSENQQGTNTLSYASRFHSTLVPQLDFSSWHQNTSTCGYLGSSCVDCMFINELVLEAVLKYMWNGIYITTIFCNCNKFSELFCINGLQFSTQILLRKIIAISFHTRVIWVTRF